MNPCHRTVLKSCLAEFEPELLLGLFDQVVILVLAPSNFSPPPVSWGSQVNVARQVGPP